MRVSECDIFREKRRHIPTLQLCTCTAHQHREPASIPCGSVGNRGGRGGRLAVDASERAPAPARPIRGTPLPPSRARQLSSPLLSSSFSVHNARKRNRFAIASQSPSPLRHPLPSHTTNTGVKSSQESQPTATGLVAPLSSFGQRKEEGKREEAAGVEGGQALGGQAFSP